MVPEGLDAFAPGERHRAYKRIRLNVFADAEGTLSATWAFTGDVSVILQNARQDEGNAYLHLGEALERMGREDEARAAYKVGVPRPRRLATRGWLKILSLP